MRYRTIFLWACFLLCDIVIVCAIGEAWIRLFVPVKNPCYYHDNILGDRRCPHQKTYGYVEPGYSNILQTNSLGMHDIERKKKKEKGVLRIIYQGDSLVSGIGVPVNKTIPRLVETYLNNLNSSYNIEVINMASAEDSTAAQLLVYRMIGKQFSPDVVICHFMADFRDNIFETHQRTRSPYFILDRKNHLQFVPPAPVDLTTPIERLKRSSMLVRLMANKLLASKLYHKLNRYKNRIAALDIRKYLKRSRQNKTKQDTPALSYRQCTIKVLTEKSWPITMQLIKTFNKEVEENGGHFILIDGMPFMPNTAGKYTNADLAKFCQENSITYLPVYKEYQKIRDAPADEGLVLQDGHPTSAGNERLSQFIAIKLNDILPKIIKASASGELNEGTSNRKKIREN